MSIKQRNDPWNEPVEVTENRADDRTEKRKAKIKYKPILFFSILHEINPLIICLFIIPLSL